MCIIISVNLWKKRCIHPKYQHSKICFQISKFPVCAVLRWRSSPPQPVGQVCLGVLAL